MPDDARCPVGGEAALALVGIGAKIGLARGQGAQGLADERDGLVLVDVADDPHFDRAAGHAVGKVGLELGEGQPAVILDRLQREARVVVGQNAADRIAQGRGGRGAQLGEEIVDADPVASFALWPVPGVADQRGEQL